MFKRLQEWLKGVAPDEHLIKFEVAATVGRAVVAIPILGPTILWLCGVVARAVTSIVPTVPAGVASVAPFASAGEALQLYWRISRFVYPMTVFACLLMSIVMSARAGTFHGSDTGVLYFSDDWRNIVLYLTVVPLYVCAGVCLIVTATASWTQLSDFVDAKIAMRTPSSSSVRGATRAALFLGASFLISGFFTAEFVMQLLNRENGPTYWFLSRTPSGSVSINIAGVYYLYMNAFLLFLTAMCAFCYMAMSVEVFRLAHEIQLRTATFAAEPTFGERFGTFSDAETRIRQQLANFMLCYGLAKFQVLIYAINIYIWQHSPMGRMRNGAIAIVVLSIIGVVFLGLPRLRLASAWHKMKLAHVRAGIHSSSVFEGFQIDDLRRWQWILDGGFVAILLSLINYQFDFWAHLDTWWLQLKTWPTKLLT
jgi:hypothetical protein